MYMVKVNSEPPLYNILDKLKYRFEYELVESTHCYPEDHLGLF